MLQLEISGGDLNDALIKLTIGTVILEPDLFQRLVTLKEKLLIELLDALKKTRIVFRFLNDSDSSQP